MSFVYPPPAPEDPSANSPSFGIGSSLEISWTDTASPYSNATLVLMKNDDNYTCSLLNLDLAYCQAIQPSFSAFDSQGISWRVSTYSYPEYPADTNPSYYLILAAFDTTGVLSKIYSDKFFIYPQDDVPTTTYTESTSQSTATSSITSSPSTSWITSSARASQTLSATSAASPGLNEVDKIAIGIAVGLGLPLIVAVALIVFFLFSKERNRPTALASKNREVLLASSRTDDKDRVVTGAEPLFELGSGPMPAHQVHGYQPQRRQQHLPFLSELPAVTRSTK